MSCRHDLPLTRCTECYPDTGDITPTWPGDSMDGPGAVPRKETSASEPNESFERGADDIIRCPSCAAEHVCLVTMDFGGDGDTQTIECACGNAFELTCHVKITFTATAVEGK